MTAAQNKAQEVIKYLREQKDIALYEMKRNVFGALLYHEWRGQAHAYSVAIADIKAKFNIKGEIE